MTTGYTNYPFETTVYLSVVDMIVSLKRKMIIIKSLSRSTEVYRTKAI